MSTNSLIAIENKDLSVESVYCHWDGYLSYNGNILHDHYDSVEKIRELIDGGNMSVLATTPAECEVYSTCGEEPAEKWACIRDLLDTVRYGDGYSGIEFVYIYTHGAWMVVDVYADTFLSLEKELSKLEEEA